MSLSSPSGPGRGCCQVIVPVSSHRSHRGGDSTGAALHLRSTLTPITAGTGELLPLQGCARRSFCDVFAARCTAIEDGCWLGHVGLRVSGVRQGFPLPYNEERLCGGLRGSVRGRYGCHSHASQDGEARPVAVGPVAVAERLPRPIRTRVLLDREHLGTVVLAPSA